MPRADPERLGTIKRLDQLIAYLRDELGWPIESENLNELTFDWSQDELRISEEGVGRLRDGMVRQMRSPPLWRQVTSAQTWCSRTSTPDLLT